MVPTLPHGCGSWIVLQDGAPVLETFDYDVATVCDKGGLEVLTAVEWLHRYQVIVTLEERRRSREGKEGRI